MKLKCIFIDPLFSSALVSLYRKGLVYEARPVPQSRISAVNIQSAEKGCELIGIPEGDGFAIVAAGNIKIAGFKVQGKRKKQFHKRETNVHNWMFDQRRARRFARQVLKRPVTNPARASDEMMHVFKKLSRRH